MHLKATVPMPTKTNKKMLKYYPNTENKSNPVRKILPFFNAKKYDTLSDKKNATTGKSMSKNFSQQND